MKPQDLVNQTTSQLLAQNSKAVDLLSQGVDRMVNGLKTANAQIIGMYKQAPEPFSPSESTLGQLQSAMDTYTKLIQLTSAYVLSTTAEMAQGIIQKTSEATAKVASAAKV